MSKRRRNIPYALAAAYKSLAAELAKAIPQVNVESPGPSNSQDVCHCIERFVDALEKIPHGRTELQSRAQLVKTRCGPRSEYDQSRALALKSYTGNPRIITGSKLAMDHLRGSQGAPTAIAQLSAERRDIERVLDERVLHLSSTSRQSFERWRDACRDVQREVEGLEVDGCWHLYHTHKAGESGRPEFSRGVKALTKWGLMLPGMQAAAESMVEWARNASGKPGSGEQKPAGTFDPDEMISGPKLAERYGVPYGRLKGRLATFRLNNDDGYRELQGRRPNDPKYAYRLGSVLQIVESLRDKISLESTSKK